MPEETQQAIVWALQQQYEIKPGVYVPVSINIPYTVVDKVREYFNTNDILYQSFSYDDLILFLQ